MKTEDGADLADLPAIRLKPGAADFGSVSETGKAFARINPLVRMGSQFGDVADKAYMSPDICLMHLSRKVGSAKDARRRAHWIGGRFYNWASGESSAYVDLSGAVIRGALRYVEDEVPNEIHPRGEYQLRLDRAEHLLERFLARAKENGLIT
ncbi:MAG: hypothetical protein N4A61_12490 [Pelagimonas sp.]|jgi:hypothetical protein|nr:hypothetical protein [Pelagimonas sp.]